MLRDSVDRAGVIVLRDGHLALIERHDRGRHYWVIPGGGVEPGETVADAALREACEELGVDVTLGQLRVRIDHREADGSFQRQWYFDAQVVENTIRVVGPELTSGRGTYAAVWVPLERLVPDQILPSAVARWILGTGGTWSDEPFIIDERPESQRHAIPPTQLG